jgi:DNA-binding NtrC family response regulator
MKSVACATSPLRGLEVAHLPMPWVRWASLRYPILIRGERGTGKSMLAERLHRASGRPGPLINRSLEAIPKGLEIAELLGHCRGAFTTAVADREGILTQANRGTAFLDELGRASLEAQGALLGFLDRGRITPVGGSREVPLDVRLIAATNADLEAMISTGSFLPDLLDRFGYYVIVTQPLRDRRGEILGLAAQFLESESNGIGRASTPRLAPGVERLFLEAPWPGNVRDLVKLCQYLVGNAGEEAGIEDLPPGFLRTLGMRAESEYEPLAARARRVVAECGGNKTEAARKLGRSRGHLHRILKASQN